MFRILLILAIIVYFLYKIGGFFFKAGAASQQFREQERKANVNSKSDRNKPDGHIKGGEYIDYEEVK
jgi:hypothetical protein